MYKTHIKLQPAEGPVKWKIFQSYTDQFKADAKRSNFDTDKTWYTELNKWTDHLTDVDKAELIELQKKLQRKFVSDDRMKAKHSGWECKRKDNDCEVPIRMRKFMLVLDKEIRKKLKESLDIPQRSSVIDVVEDFKRKGLVKHLQRFVLFCGDIRQNIHHIVQFIKFYVDNKGVISKSSTPVTDMPDITNMPLENTEDDEAFKKAMKLVQSYMAWDMSFLETDMSFLETAEGRFLSAEPGAHAPLLAHMLFGNPVEYIFTSLLGLIKTFVGFSVIVIAILCLLAWLCPTEPTSQTPEPTSRTHNDMEKRIQEEQDMQQRRRVHQQRRRVHESMRDDLLKKYKHWNAYTALDEYYHGVIPLSKLQKLADNVVTVTEEMKKTFENFAGFWEGMCPICMEQMEDANNVKCCNCGHSFHASCINGWLPAAKTAKTCPICRDPCGEGLVLGEIGETLETLVAKKDELEKAKTKREAEKREQQRDEEEKKDVEKAKTEEKKDDDSEKVHERSDDSESDDSASDDSDSDDPEYAWARRKGYLY